MKRSLRNSILLLLTAMLLTVSALADSGPKAQLTVKVVNAPSEPYYLDLLEKGDYQGHTYGSGDGDDTYSGLDWSYSEEEIAALYTKWETLHPHLAGFARVALKAGEKRQIAVPLDKNAFTVVNDAGERVADGKVFDVYCGLYQPDERSAELTGQTPVKMTIRFE
ncbi:MAG: hypothetical protein EGS70_04755 [Clostridiales bacterium]|nr:hypothetical protein [Clostridiales bacterium]